MAPRSRGRRAHHLEQRRVVEDDVGRHALLARELEAAARAAPATAPRRRARRRRRAPAARRARSRGARRGGCASAGVAAEGDRHLAAQHRAARSRRDAARHGPRHRPSRWPCATSWRNTDCHSRLSSSVPTPKVLSLSWPKLLHALGRLAEQHVDEIGRRRSAGRCGTPPRAPSAPRPARPRRAPACRQLSQLPQGGWSRSPK